MASAFPVSIMDEDGFDWDAAVREIDVACEATSSSVPSASLSVPPASYIAHKSHPHQGTATALGSVKECKSRQSTLDMFISRKCPRKSLEEVHTDHGEFNGDNNDRVCHVQIDREAAKTWIYPVNVPLRDYQFSITKTALFSNTLVALPTGLGKTLIAAVVIYNYFRWFPEGKIIFAAPSRPLVMQQIEACHNVVGIPQEWTIDMTGSTSPPRRAKQWKAKRVFFLTPQILENDIKSGICTGKDIVCLVVDEAHRAMGNFAFCGAVRKLMDALAQFRILALSATPGSKQQSIQQVIDNLCISTLEYRNESDQDVSPYVQNRKIELIEVSMGKDALHSDEMLLNVIRPLIGRLCALRVLQNRNVTAWSPSDLLNWRDKFRQAPPPDLAHVNCGEVEGCFSVLITLYHIRKLLSAHGIKPAYDMLEEKLQQGPFARIMGRNEDIHYIKLSMQKSLSHGAPTPKLAKLLEVVTDHFNTKDPLSSRVIIFSNFRGSVRDIMSKLETVGEHVKPTEFIGQSSGKTLKGQSQKVQQEVLKKFRAGGYNVIVATSIGEEGLDIMEVDLVICFDANVSPLRMIQRMGRTGRKHDGRVVVLACEGSEMKGYKRKLATSNSMRKHLHNGGRTSFNFHPSPRMVPHIFKPEVQYVELSIEQFVHRGKAMKDDPSIQSPKPIDKLNDTEIQLLKMYFPTGGDCTWKPSLIAFPSCQSFPSRVYEVKHSFRTGMLIDAMQQLQGFSNIGYSRMISVEETASPFQCAGGECISIDQSEFESPNKYMKCRSGGDAKSFQSSPVKDKVFISEHDAGDYATAENNFHCHLFRSEFVSVDPLGRISIMPAPILPYKEYVNSLSPQPSVADDLSMHNNKIVDPVLDEINQLPGTPELIKRISTNEDYDGETPDIMAHRPSIVECHVIKVDQQDVQLSPRLTNFMLSGVVPESPECGMQNDDGGINLLDPEFSSPTKHCRGALLRPSCVEECEFTCAENGTTRQNFAAANKGTHTPRVCTNPSGIPMASPNILEELRTPLLDLTSDNCSNDWYPDSGNKTETLKKPRKLKRLRRHRDCLTNNMEHKSMVDANPSASTFRYPHSAETERQIDEVRGFIDEEAEVSSRSDVSGDEEDEKDCSSYDDSFIDDKTSLSEATTQAEAGSIDMMAIYRRSLLSQSPLVRQPVYNNTDPDFVALVTNTTEKGSSSPKMMDCNSRRMIGHRIIPTPCLGSNRQNSKGNVLSANPCSSSRSSVVSRKRKLSAHQADIIPPMNLEKQFFASEAEVAIQTSQADKTDFSGKLFYDDDFFEGLDLDAVEAQATLLLKNKAEAQTLNQNTYNEPGSSPTFDLGI